MVARQNLTGVLLLLALLSSPAVLAENLATNRYAFIIGNNHGQHPQLQQKNLLHAEREARRLTQTLIEKGRFSKERVILVNGAGHQAIKAAFERLLAVRQKDKEYLGSLPTLFAIFYSGHGFNGNLLTADQPLTGRDLAEFYKRMDASLSLGFFDACFSGSLNPDVLAHKGLVSTPGFNPRRELPEELLSSEGTLWYVSSKPDEFSFEDKKLGGLLTHYFIEAFEQAPEDSAGITLDSMWEYTRQKTLAHAARYGRMQTPSKYVSRLKAQGPLYFGFPHSRNAGLVFTEEVSGDFLLQYAQGALVEKINKPAGRRMEVSVYASRVTLIKLQDDSFDQAPTWQWQIGPGEQVWVHPKGTKSPSPPPGYRQQKIVGKGSLPDLQLVAQKPGPRWALGLGYRFHLPRSERILNAEHLGAIVFSLQWGNWVFDFDMAWGKKDQDHESWAVKINELALGLSGGWSQAIWHSQLQLMARLEGSWLDVAYGNQETRNPLGAYLGAMVRWQLPLPFTDPWLLLQLEAGLGGRFSQGLVQGDHDYYTILEPRLGLSLSLPF
jgi:hypothetical protein